jgi:hypothetical protein
VWDERRGESWDTVKETKAENAGDAIEAYVLADIARDPAAAQCYPCDLRVSRGTASASVYVVDIRWTPDVVALMRRDKR